MYSLGNRWKEGSNGEFQISSLENWADNDSVNQDHREPKGLQFNILSESCLQHSFLSPLPKYL